MGDLARIAYEAYARSRRTKSDGRPMPEWQQLSREIQLAWLAAIEAVMAAGAGDD